LFPFGGFGPALSLPIFDGGRLRGQLRGSEAEYALAVASYDRTLVQALQDVADAEIDRDRIPRRADAEAVHMLARQAVDHVGRRQHHQAHVLVRIDAARRHPQAKLIVVVGERKRHAERERLGIAALALGHGQVTSELVALGGQADEVEDLERAMETIAVRGARARSAHVFPPSSPYLETWLAVRARLALPARAPLFWRMALVTTVVPCDSSPTSAGTTW